MEVTLKTQIKVGIFLLVGLAIVLISIFMIGGDRSIFTSQVRLHAHFDQVQGLAEGSVVSLSGVNIGNIERIDFVSEANKLDVVMKIDKKFLPRVTQGSMVEIRTQGALGDKYIYVIPSDPRNPPLAEDDVLDVAKPTDIIGIFSERGKETEKIFDIINDLHKMTTAITAEGRMEKIMSGMAVASTNLSAASVEAKKFTTELGTVSASHLKSSFERLDSLLAKMDRGEGTLGGLINDPTVHEQLKALLGGSTRRQHIKSMIRTSIEKSGE